MTEHTGMGDELRPLLDEMAQALAEYHSGGCKTIGRALAARRAVEARVAMRFAALTLPADPVAGEEAIVAQIVQRVKEACAQVADRAAERYFGMSLATEIATSIRALIPTLATEKVRNQPTIDSVPSCGQENDYRRASPALPEEKAVAWTTREEIGDIIDREAWRMFKKYEHDLGALPLDTQHRINQMLDKVSAILALARPDNSAVVKEENK